MVPIKKCFFTCIIFQTIFDKINSVTLLLPPKRNHLYPSLNIQCWPLKRLDESLDKPHVVVVDEKAKV